MRIASKIGAVALVSFGLMALYPNPAAYATMSILGGEVQVNTSTSSDQRGWIYSPKNVAVFADGSSIVVFGSSHSGNWDCFYQRYDSDGAPLGGETPVNTTTSGEQFLPVVVARPDDSFIIGWQGNGPGDPEGIFFRIFDSGGNALTGELRANSYVLNADADPAAIDDRAHVSIACDADGDFVAAWSSINQDGSDRGIYAQRFDSLGQAIGSEFLVNSYTGSNQNRPIVACKPTGEFVVTWYGIGSGGSGNDVYLRRYNSSGNPLATESRVNTETLYSQAFQSIAMRSDGSFVIVWDSQIDSGGTDVDIHFRRYDSSGNALAAPAVANTYTTARQLFPMVTADENGTFAVIWESEGQDAGDKGIYAQRFLDDGTKFGCEYKLNTHQSGTQEISSIATNSTGSRLVATWVSNGQDGSGKGVYKQSLMPLAVTPSDLTVCEGDDVVLSIESLDTGLTYQWRKGGADIPTETNPTLNLMGVDAQEVGVYDCVVTSTCNVSQSVTTAGSSLAIEPAPIISGNIVTVRGVLGTWVSFSVESPSMPPITYRWEKDGLPISDTASVTGTNTALMSINPLTVGDGGIYTCVITTTCPITEATSQPMKLIVVPDPSRSSEWLVIGE